MKENSCIHLDSVLKKQAQRSDFLHKYNHLSVIIFHRLCCNCVIANLFAIIVFNTWDTSLLCIASYLTTWWWWLSALFHLLQLCFVSLFVAILFSSLDSFLSTDKWIKWWEIVKMLDEKFKELEVISGRSLESPYG